MVERTNRDPEMVRIFSLSSTAEHQIAMPGRKAEKSPAAAQPPVFPRIARMFSRPVGDDVEAAKEKKQSKPLEKTAKGPKQGR
jgi:hypothetical protein